MDEIEKKLGYSFKNIDYLKTALTHSSYANENRRSGAACNERLEFLGDSVLGMTVAAYLFRTCPDMPEGPMTRLRAELVCEQSLYGVAQKLELGKYLRLGHGEEQGGGRERPSILADAVEAILAAVYLDGGQAKAEKLVKKYIIGPYEAGAQSANQDYKTMLQELVQRKSGQTLVYSLLGESGPDHDKKFRSQVLINGEPVGAGDGRNKKEAEQMAARAAIEGLTK
ncbi:MAG: ribonuclease III [Oscillospiraceae bacterium]